MVALWWVRTLRRLGPTPDAFTFRMPFPPPGAGAGRVDPEARVSSG